MLDVAGLVLALRHFGERQVRDRRQNLVQLLLGRLRLGLQRRQRHLQLIDLGHQLLRRGLVLLRLGRADLLRRRVPPRLRLLGLQDRGAAALVDGEQIRRRKLLLDSSSSGRRFSALSNSAAFSRIHLMSCIVGFLGRCSVFAGIRRGLISAANPLSQRFAGPVCLRRRARRVPFSVSPQGMERREALRAFARRP